MYFDPHSKEFYNTRISQDCVQLSSERFQTLLAARRQGKIIIVDVDTGEVIATDPPPVEIPPESLEMVFHRRMNDLGSEYEVAFSAIRSTYPAAESTTWDRQATEAELYHAWVEGGRVGTAPPTPFIDDLNTYRTKYGVGSGKDDLVERILNNSAAFRPAIANITAARHAAEKALNAAFIAQDMTALKAVGWNLLANLQV